MTTAKERVQEQTAIRRALLRNGYTPLANIDKMCVLPGWPGLKVDEAMIEDWAAQLRYGATGVRVDGDLVVLDFDIDDAAMLDAIWEALPGRLARLLDAAPMRFGKGDKFALFMRRRAGERIGYTVSQGYAPPGKDCLMRVEVFGSEQTRQVGVYGAHSHAEDGSIANEYSWAEDRGLADVPLAELPEISSEQIKQVLDIASHTMRKAGWQYEVATHVGSVDARPAFDISEDAIFNTRDHGEVVGVEALEALCDVSGPGVRLSASWLEGAGAVNTSRCIARLNAADGRLQIWESARCVLHRPEGMDIRAKVEELGARLRRLSEDSTLSRQFSVADSGKSLFQDAPETEAFAKALDTLLSGWAWVAQGNGFAAPVGGTPDQMLSLGGLRNTMAPWCKIEKRGNRQVKVNPVDVWIEHSDRLLVAGHRLLPWSQDRVVEDERGQVWLNTYELPSHALVEPCSDAEKVWTDFLTHLVPDPKERAWFEMWLAAKVQKPWLPNCGVVMVAETHGTGRGTLFDILAAVFGKRHVRPVTSTELMGGSGQGQYTDWLADSLIVTCDELLAGNDSGRSMEWKRREVYERLKTLVDPRTRMVRIVRKGLPSYDTEVYASFLLATNNTNALPLAEQDRRFAVLRNTDTKLVDAGGALHARLSSFRDDREQFNAKLSAAVWRRLMGLAVDWEAIRDAPEWLVGRGDMLEANEGDLEEIVRSVLDDVPGDYILNEHLRDRVRLALESCGMLGEIKNWWVRTQDLLSRRNSTGWRRMARRQEAAPRGAGRKFVTVYYRVAGPGEEVWAATKSEDRVALWKRGSDLNDKLSRLESKVRERGIRVIE